MVALLLLLQAAASATDFAVDRPAIRARFASYIWTLQNSTDSLFVETTTFTAVDDRLGCVSTNQTLKDGRYAANIGCYANPARPQDDGVSSRPGVWNLDPFFDRHVCYIFPPQIPGDPTHTTVTFPLALELVYGVALDWYNSSTQAGTKTIHGRECELWLYVGDGGDHERVVYCVERSTGALLSVNRTAWEYDGAHNRNITVESLNVLYAVNVDPPPSLFTVPPLNQCADLRALADREDRAEEEEEEEEPENSVSINDGYRLNRINKAIAAAGGGWTAGANIRAGIDTVAEARKLSTAGGVRFQRLRNKKNYGSYVGAATATPPPLQPMPPSSIANSLDDVPADFDSRVAWPTCSSIQMPRDQGRCGSCWVRTGSALCFKRPNEGGTTLAASSVCTRWIRGCF